MEQKIGRCRVRPSTEPTIRIGKIRKGNGLTEREFLDTTGMVIGYGTSGREIKPNVEYLLAKPKQKGR